MMTLLKCNQLLYPLLNDALQGELRGGTEYERGAVYTADTRVQDDKGEAVVIQTIAITHGYPQKAQGNIVIYVPDKYTRNRGGEQYIADTQRLQYLTALVVEVLEGLHIEGIGLTVQGESYFDVAEIHQHAVSISISLNILIP